MLYPSIDLLLNKTKSKYMLVVATAKRARELKESNRPKVIKTKSNKMVGIALEEIANDDIKYVYGKRKDNQ